uniref:hypothetical protein n=1 Tax=Nocardiopsis sp. FIRDI 009 TaxID=714197 RepID=UPI000E289F80
MRYLLLFLLASWPLARATVRPELPDTTADAARRLLRGVRRPRRAAHPRRYARPGPALPFVVSGPADLLRLVTAPPSPTTLGTGV